MIYLASYDISDDQLRRKVAAKMLQYGLERIQYSVFLGDITARNLALLEDAIKGILQKSNLQAEKLLFIPVTRQQLDRMRSWGTETLDLDYLCGDKLVLFL